MARQFEVTKERQNANSMEVMKSMVNLGVKLEFKPIKVIRTCNRGVANIFKTFFTVDEEYIYKFNQINKVDVIKYLVVPYITMV